MSTTIIPGCKMGAKVTHAPGDIRVHCFEVATLYGDGALDVFCCSHADVFSCTPYDDLSKERPDGLIVTLCSRCEKKFLNGARVVDEKSNELTHDGRWEMEAGLDEDEDEESIFL
jgi:hypothetical protein